jgi:pantoate--beta-alanine ligase
MSRPEVITSIEAMQEASKRARRRGTIALVPTMGALHEGHLSLVKAARNACDMVVVSIFVNPTQFGPKEDYERYPRTLGEDLELLGRDEVDFVFTPRTTDMYPAGNTATLVEVPSISDRLDGASRMGHFRGVATVVAKLFHITLPDAAFFGQKDAAQVAVLRAMVRDLNFPVSLVVCPTVRESDGLAMSSRNRYLTVSERVQSLALYRALSEAHGEIDRGVRDARELRGTMMRVMRDQPAMQTEYVEVVDPDTLLPVEDVSKGALLAVAARVGGTRLIDNVLLPPPAGSDLCE